MNPVYYDVTSFLQANGFGTIGTSLAGGEWNRAINGKEIDRQTLVLEGVGIPSDLKDLYEQPSVQILVRGDKIERDVDVYRRAYDIRKFLLSQPETVELNGTCYKGFEEGSNLAPLGKDDNQRHIYSMNLFTWRNS